MPKYVPDKQRLEQRAAKFHIQLMRIQAANIRGWRVEILLRRELELAERRGYNQAKRAMEAIVADEPFAQGRVYTA